MFTSKIVKRVYFPNFLLLYRTKFYYLKVSLPIYNNILEKNSLDKPVLIC